MVKLFLWCIGILLLSGCNIQKWIDATVEWDRRHSLEQANDTFDIASKIDAKGHLDLSWLDLPQIPDVCRLLNPTDLRKVQSLDLSDNRISSISGLDCLPNLIELDLSNNNIDSLIGFPLMANLKKLNLARNKLKDLEGIELLVWIIELQLGENFLEDIEWLQYLKDLQKLWLELNKLKDLDVLQYLDELKEVSARYNELKGNIQEMLDQIPDIDL